MARLCRSRCSASWPGGRARALLCISLAVHCVTQGTTCWLLLRAAINVLPSLLLSARACISACSHWPNGVAGETPRSVKPAGPKEGSNGSQAQPRGGDLATALLLSPSQVRSPGKRRASTSSSDVMRTQASKAQSGSRLQLPATEQQPGEHAQQLDDQPGVAPAQGAAGVTDSAQAAVPAADVAAAPGTAFPGVGPCPGSCAEAEEQQQGRRREVRPVALPNQQQPAVAPARQAAFEFAPTQVVLPTLALTQPLQPVAQLMHALPASGGAMQAVPTIAFTRQVGLLPATAAAGSQLPLLPPTQELAPGVAEMEFAVAAQEEPQLLARPSAAAATNAEAQNAAGAAAAAGVAAAAVAAALASVEAASSGGATAGAKEPAAPQAARSADAAAEQPCKQQQQQQEVAMLSGRKQAMAAGPAAAVAGNEEAAGDQEAEACIKDVALADAAAETAGQQGLKADAQVEAMQVDVRPPAGQATELLRATAQQQRAAPSATGTPASPAAAVEVAGGKPSGRPAVASTPLHMLAPTSDLALVEGSGGSSESRGEDSGTGGSGSGSSSEEESEAGSQGEADEAVPPSPLCTADELAMARQQERQALLARHGTQTPSGVLRPAARDADLGLWQRRHGCCKRITLELQPAGHRLTLHRVAPDKPDVTSLFRAHPCCSPGYQPGAWA